MTTPERPLTPPLADQLHSMLDEIPTAADRQAAAAERAATYLAHIRALLVIALLWAVVIAVAVGLGE